LRTNSGSKLGVGVGFSILITSKNKELAVILARAAHYEPATGITEALDCDEGRSPQLPRAQVDSVDPANAHGKCGLC
jgi:hypothetical protein